MRNPRDLALDFDFDIELAAIEHAIADLSLKVTTGGIDPSGSADFQVCAFCTSIAND